MSGKVCWERSGDDWDVRTLDGDRVFGHVRFDTLEQARAAIGLVKDDAVSPGALPQRYLICNREWVIRYDDDGHFVSSDELTTVVETYPEVIA